MNRKFSQIALGFDVDEALNERSVYNYNIYICLKHTLQLITLQKNSH